MREIKSAEIVMSAVSESQYPTDSGLEIAVAGRSNVGKSSFINSLLNRKALARTSSKPGKTRTINFFLINNSYYLVDVPGYGYAKVSKKEREKWGNMMNHYFSSRQSLALTILLVDARHKPSELDLQMYTFLKYYQLPTLVVATKADKLKARQKEKNYDQIIQYLDLDPSDQCILYSSKTKEGKKEVWSYMSQFM